MRGFGIRPCLLTILGGCLFLAVAQKRDSTFIDLTKIRPAPIEKPRKRGGGGVSGSNDTRIPTLPIRDTLLSLDKGSYQIGEEIIYEIAIRNIGHESVAIPWSPYEDKVKPVEEVYPPGYLAMNLGLVFNDELLGEQTVFGPWLYGSEHVPSSLRKLLPGQTLRIRASTRWLIMNADVSQRILSRLPQKYVVRVKLSFLRDTFTPQPTPVVSENGITLELNKRKQ